MADAIKSKDNPLPAIVWIFDSGAEGPFPVSLFSLSRAAPSLYTNAPLIVLDCGMSADLYDWLLRKGLPNLTLIKCTLPEPFKVMGVSHTRASSVMRQRIELPTLLSLAMQDGRVPYFETFLQIDTDTVFLSDPTDVLTQRWSGEDIRCCYEWDWSGDPKDDLQESMKFIRESSFFSQGYSAKLPDIANAFGVSVGELRCIPTVNSGVWMSKVRGKLSEKWIKSYEHLLAIDRRLGPGLFSSYSAEQNALSLGIYFGDISIRSFERRINNLPPKDPQEWPPTVVIAHFVSLKKNWPRSAYRLLSKFRHLTQESGYAPRSLLFPELVDPDESGLDSASIVDSLSTKTP
jgi:hypothetical protein